jgi:hypothetical protein
MKLLARNHVTLFYAVRAATVAMQRRGKHSSTTIEAVFSAWFVLKVIGDSEGRLKSVLRRRPFKAIVTSTRFGKRL